MWSAADFKTEEFVASRTRRPSQSGRMTVKKLTALIASGFGQGHFHRYKPWLSVAKHDYSPVSTMGHLPAPELARAHHYRAMAEKHTILLAKWLGAIDAREAYPVWPWAHAHPGFGLPDFPYIELKGLLAIAEEAGIRHGVYPGTSLPYVATLDILTTWRKANGDYLLVALENKPRDIVFAPKVVSRPKGRLELTRRYCHQANIRSHIVHAEEFPDALGTNLDHFAPSLSELRQQTLRSSPLYVELVERLAADGYSQSIADVVDKFAARHRVSRVDPWALLRLAIWTQDIDHDIAQPYNTWTPLIRGGRSFRDTVRGSFTGELS